MFGVRKWPVFATIVVIAAAAVMVLLGMWQLQRRAQEQTKLARFEAAAANPAPVAFPTAPGPQADTVLFRRSALDCTPQGWRATAGSGAAGTAGAGQGGYVQIVDCGNGVSVQAGWARDLAAPAWPGGRVSGVIVPNRDGSLRLLADPPIAGLGPSKLPEKADPGQNLAYAVQWFVFAFTALVIYVLALRRAGR